MTRRAGSVLAVVLTVLSLSLMAVMPEPVSASIVKPSVPDFTVRFVDYSYDVPTTKSVDPYTGETVIHPAYRVENRCIEIGIKNQPFTPYQVQDSAGNNWTVNFFYNIRAKGHFGQDWNEAFHPSDGFPIQSDSEHTVISFYSTGGEDFYATSTSVVHAPSGGQVDFQVKAMIGYVSRANEPPWYPWVFAGETSGWSETQTLTIPASSSPSGEATKPTEGERYADESQQTAQLNAILGIAIIAIVVGATLGLLRYFKKRKR